MIREFFELPSAAEAFVLVTMVGVAVFVVGFPIAF